jgi:FPC/CPF motif-containing protein YcgG
MLRFSRVIAFRANVNADKLKPTWEEVAFAEIQRETVGATANKFTPHVGQQAFEGVSPADNIVNNDAGNCAIIDGQVV